MKFSSDKKSSLFIYANENLRNSDDKMESALKKELEATKSALRLQTIRCRQLVAAFTRKLHEKEVELRASKDLRDQQLSRLLRALLILESRLKKEQKLIRKQLEEKDLIIEKQEKEILIYKLSETNKKWPKVDELNAKKGTGGEKWENLDARYYKTTGEERLDNLCKGLTTSQFYEIKEKNETDETRGTIYSKKAENTFKDNPVLESVNQILLRDEEELLKEAQPVDITLNEKVMFDGVGGTNEWYETNSNIVPEEQPMSEAWCIKVEEGEEVKQKKEMWPTGKTSPIKSQHLEEKACLEMSKKNLTIVNLEEIDSNSGNKDRAPSPAKSTASYEEILTVPKSPTNSKPSRTTQKPPALPPKPARLLKPHQILQQKNKNLLGSLHNGESLAPKIQTTPTITFAQPVNKNPSDNHLTQLKMNTNNRHLDTADNSRPRPKPPDPTLKPNKIQLNNFTKRPVDLKSVASQFGNQKKKEESLTNCGAIKIGSSVSSIITGLSRDTIVTELTQDPVPALDDSRVSQMVRQFEVLSKFNVIESTRAEDEINDMRKNFEEFKLEESYVEAEESGRHDGDGAETRNMVNYYATLTIVPPPPPPPLPKEPPPETEMEFKMYETFLENTGLSQKSILTPSRMLSNHRSCIKPKDVKHRSRVKAAAAIEKCHPNPTNPESTVKYWTEPFL